MIAGILRAMETVPQRSPDRLRAYALADRDDCLALFDSNVPGFFDASERPDFASFLEQRAFDCAYQVIARDRHIIACGGVAIEPYGVTASLCWGMVERSRHGSGLGHRLTEARLASARAIPGVKQVRLHTSQHTQGFYARFGFQPEAIIPDDYGPGLDRWEMLLRF